MSLDLWLEEPQTVMVSVFDDNITHNMTAMANEAGIFECLWKPHRVNATTGKDLIEPLEKAIEMMLADPDRFKAFNAPNGWGTYDDFLPWIQELLKACKEHPNATLGVCV